MDFEGLARTYVIRKSQHLGFGFLVGHEAPTIVKVIQPNGPSHKRLMLGDIILAVNGVNVENMPREQIVKMIQLCEEIEITVKQPSYEELIRAKSLSNPRFNTISRTSNFSHQSQNNLSVSQTPPPITAQSPLNRLVTSISQQQQQQQLPSSPIIFNRHGIDDTPPVQIKTNSATLVKQKPKDGPGFESINSSKTLSRSSFNCDRNSPIRQRCKSSMDGVIESRSMKNNDNSENDRPLLKRSNTMRPIKLPSRVTEIFEVVIKIFFEVGHTRVLNYNQDTTVGTILETLSTRLVTSSPHSDQIKNYFGLALTVGVNTEGSPKDTPKRKSFHILDENISIMEIRQLPYSTQLRLLYRMVYPPADVSRLYAQDKVAFEYLYQQSCNDLKLERFTPEIDKDTAIRLSALFLLEYVHSNYSKSHGNSKDPKVYIKLIKKTPGIDFFLPASIVESTIDKKGKRIISQVKKIRAKIADQLKKNFDMFDFDPPRVKSTTNLNCNSSTSFHELSLPEMQSSPSDYIKLLFLTYLSQLPCYGDVKRPVGNSISPQAEQTSVGDCSSLESVPRTIDSSPTTRQNRMILPNNQTNDRPNFNNISRLAHMNSMRSINSSNVIRNSAIDQPDMVQTPSMESVSSITFNSPSPQMTTMYPQSNETFANVKNVNGSNNHIRPIKEPAPLPRQQLNPIRLNEQNSIDRLYGQRYRCFERPIENNWKINNYNSVSQTIEDLPYQIPGRRNDFNHIDSFTQVLSDIDIEKLKVPPPPKLID